MGAVMSSMRASLAVMVIATAACAHASLDDARAAYAQGDLRRTETLLADVEPASDADKRQVSEMQKSVQVDKKRVLDSLLADAGRARGRADEGTQGYNEVIGYYEAALALLQPRDAQAKTIKQSLFKAEDAQRAREQSFSIARKKFEEAAKCNGAQQRDRLGELWALRRACDSTMSLVHLTLKAAQRCAKAERYEDALLLRSVLDETSRGQQSSLDEWPASAQGWFALVEIRAQERALHTATTTTSSTATFGPAAQAAATHRAAQSTRVSPPPRTPSSPPSTSGAVASGRADQVLGKARKLYDDGSVFDALLALDAGLSEDLSDGDRAKLNAQEETWSPDRRRLIDEYLRRGESALREEQIESAYAWYQRILTLDPSHEVAQDRVRRLDRLKTLKSAQ